MIGRRRLSALVAAASMGLSLPIARHYEHDDAPEPDAEPRPLKGSPLPHIVAGHDPNKHVEYYESKKPLTKRQKRRLRGKGKQP